MKVEILEKTMTESDYIRMEEKSSIRHEMINGELHAMAGASRKHNLICHFLTNLFWRLLQGRRFLAFQENMKVQITTESDYTYPDVVVTFDEKDISSPDNEYIFRSPTLIVEVLSPSTRAYDRTDKFLAYRKISSLKHYLTVDAEKIFVEWYCKNDDGEWNSEIYTQMDESIFIPDLNIEIPLLEIYKF